MRNLSYSFKPDNTYFLFDIDTGRTVQTYRADGKPLVLKTARAARMAWIRERGA